VLIVSRNRRSTGPLLRTRAARAARGSCTSATVSCSRTSSSASTTCAQFVAALNPSLRAARYSGQGLVLCPSIRGPDGRYSGRSENKIGLPRVGGAKHRRIEGRAASAVGFTHSPAPIREDSSRNICLHCRVSQGPLEIYHLRAIRQGVAVVLVREEAVLHSRAGAARLPSTLLMPLGRESIF
jgi:hypothetical protein